MAGKDPFREENEMFSMRTSGSTHQSEDLILEREIEVDSLASLRDKASKVLERDEDLIVATEHGVREQRRFEVAKVILEALVNQPRKDNLMMKHAVAGSHKFMRLFDEQEDKLICPVVQPSGYFSEAMVRALVECYLLVREMRDELTSVEERSDSGRLAACLAVVREHSRHWDLLAESMTQYVEDEQR